ncbi:cupin domain-containing protein [Romboutsia sp. 1001713B170131_170501_G6]|uniref:cupin domain-containing protein n=1 Tax=Romboutsia sp. 1001713B170131_170501_G6 TaxID=2787108 RepID=UPI0018ABFAC2|nr:cupin domain-containing protein [Romboutsia sp. 1001713B170131_170501_G6]
MKLIATNLNNIETNREILVQNEKFKNILFKFEEGKGLPNHTHNGYATVQVISGSVDIEFKTGEKFVLNPGDFLPFDARVEHNVIARELSSILVTIIF